MTGADVSAAPAHQLPVQFGFDLDPDRVDSSGDAAGRETG